MTITRRTRAKHYHPLRAGLEWGLEQLYRGDWPARLWALYPPATRVRCVQKQLAILPPSAAKLRIGFVSDLHIGPTTPPALLDAAFDRLAQARLDVLLLGGDYVFLHATPDKATRLAQLVQRVPAATKIAVLGNHDFWTDHRTIENALTGVGVSVLENQSVWLRPGIALIGLDDPWTGRVDAAHAVRDLDAPAVVVVLCHSPDGLPKARCALAELPSAPAGLYLCGHTHGGHLAAPWGPLVVPGKIGKLYPHGLHHLPPLQLYVSRGVGGTEVPMRSFAPPEVAVFELEPRPV